MTFRLHLIVFLFTSAILHCPGGASGQTDEQAAERLADYQFLSKAPSAPGKWAVEILPLKSHVAFADAEKTVPCYCVGDEITVRFVLTNESSEPLSTLPIPHDSSRMMTSGDAQLLFEEEEIVPERREAAGRIGWVPQRKDDVVTLAPGEERTFEWKLPMFWTLPVRGEWEGQHSAFQSGIKYQLPFPVFFRGSTGRYRLVYHMEYPEGWEDLLHQRGLDGNFFEGTIEAEFQLEFVPPDAGRKEELLREAKNVLRDPRHKAEYPPSFLQCYYVAPRELEELLLDSRNSANQWRLYYTYRGLEMFDTPQAESAIEEFKTWQPNRFQKILPSLLRFKMQPQENFPVAYYIEYVIAGRLLAGILVFVSVVVTVSVLWIRRRMKRKKLHIST